MEEEVNYVTVTFKPNDRCNDMEIIYEEVKSEGQVLVKTPVRQENVKKAPLYTFLKLLAAGLGIICVILVSVIIVLSIHIQMIISGHDTKYSNLTAEIFELWMEKADLLRQTDELRRERDAFNWTMSVILEFDNFPVYAHCPQKVCKSCLDGWVLFHSKCYLFADSNYYKDWKEWDKSREYCRQMKADLVVIESQDEQEFINNHIKDYNDDRHGYWIGLTEQDASGEWLWVDGSNLTVKFLIHQQRGYSGPCVLILARADPLANWNKASCYMRSLWICEARALTKPD
ncbi:hypothetical protein LDENG_00035880 [Lucifuga dentata]|nr:hypothetical protein LDENG_00035880 [Lucifuga dentata]